MQLSVSDKLPEGAFKHTTFRGEAQQFMAADQSTVGTLQ